MQDTHPEQSDNLRRTLPSQIRLPTSPFMISTLPTVALDNDSLLMIFEEITHYLPNIRPNSKIREDLTRPLDVLRAASQVCRQWRALSLDIPFIWGRVIDLDIEMYGPQRREWMLEVVKRAGSAPLSITGLVVTQQTPFGFDPLSFFIELLDSWKRIEVLSITIPSTTVPPDILARFLHRAPMLKHFEVVTPYLYQNELLGALQSWASPALFANYAPSLKTMNTNCIAFRLDSSWLNGITEMVPIPSRLDLKSIFVLLQNAPMLRNIEIVRGVADGPGDLPRLGLLNLTSIALASGFLDAKRILEHLSPGKLSTLVIKITEFWRDTVNTNHDIPVFKDSLSLYIHNYFTSNLSTHVRVKLTRNRFEFHDISKQNDRLQTLKVELFHREMGDTYARDMHKLLTGCALDAIINASNLVAAAQKATRGLFDSVKEITLDLGTAQPGLLSRLRPMLALFHHIEIIRTDERSGQKLFLTVCYSDQISAAGGKNHCIPFPKLHTLQVIGVSGYITKNLLDHIDLILARKRMGYPLARFELTLSGHSYGVPKLKGLEKLSGLEVVWK